MVELLATMTIANAVNDRWPAAVNRADIYAFRDGETVFYVGSSKASVYDRICAHLGLSDYGWEGVRRLTELIEDNLPDALTWQIDLYRALDDILFTESLVIEDLRPVLNAMHNRNPRPLPERYKTEAYRRREEEKELAARRVVRAIMDGGAR